MHYPKLIESKTSDHELFTIEWNPGMDLLASVFKNGALTCSRLLSLQKVWHKQLHGRIISIAWRPDGRVLAIGAYNEKTKEYICTLHDVENGKKVNSITKEQAITSVAWFEDKDKGEDYVVGPLKKPNLKTSVINENFSHQLAHEQTQLNILMISTEDGKISFYALGLFYLGDIHMHDEDSNSKIVKTHMSNCLRYITAVIQTKFSNYAATSLRVVQLETFQRRSNEILRVSKMYAKITDELEYLDDTISAINHSWADVLAGLDSKLSSYCSRKNIKPDESAGYTFLSADELLQLLVIGFPSDNLEKFLTDMSDKGLKKLNNAIEQTCLRVQNLIVKNAQKCCYHLHNDLNYLRGMSLWHERYEEVGLNDKFIVEAMRTVGSLMLKLTELQQVIDHSLKSTKSFFRWLISIACRMTGEQSNSAVPNDINKTTQQDIQLITDFILENFDYNSNQDDLDPVSATFNDQPTNDGVGSGVVGSGIGAGGGGDDGGVFSNRPTCSNFTLEQVGQYLKYEPLSRQKYSFIKPHSNFWIEFFKSRPELTKPDLLGDDGSNILLFYPHNADTSLLQEHKRTCKSIEAAFESVAANMKTVLNNSESLIHLKDVIRNGPTSRIRVETDLKVHKHYMLFQLKQEPVLKQYLASQSLQDLTFQLISIEFSTLNPPSILSGTNTTTGSGSSSKSARNSGRLMISDSSFYENKETKKMLITFLLLDKLLGDSIIVQVELNKFIEAAIDHKHGAQNLRKIFKTHDSIETSAKQIAIKLDIYTDPACDRRHLFDGKVDELLMVKKIKSTLGRDMFCSSGRGVIAFTSCENKRLHLYELESIAGGLDIMDDEVEGEEKIDESLIDTDLLS